MNSTKIYAIIVTFNPDISLLGRQLNSLTGQVSSIVLVDNASKNRQSIIDLLLKEFPSAKMIQNDENNGLGCAQNRGIIEAKKTGASDVVLLDQDSVPNVDCISHLIQARSVLQSSNINVGAVGPVYYNEITKNVYPISQYYGPFINRIVPIDKPTKASFLIASGCLINLSDLEEIGFMNEELFIDYIDIEWSFRAQARGFELFAVPNALMIHAIGDNSFAVAGREISNHSPLRRYYLCRNSIRMIKDKNVPFGYKLRELVLNLIRLFMFFVFSNDRSKYLRYSFQGFLDGFKNVGGICKHKFH